MTESSEHFSEYVPWFIKRWRPISSSSTFRSTSTCAGAKRRSRSGRRWKRGSRTASTRTAGRAASRRRDRARAKRLPFTFNGNVPNTFEGRRLIDNLPADCCVEVPCVASVAGVEPQKVGALPRHLAALIQTNVNVQGLTVAAALSADRESVYRAAMLDPHTAAELPLDEIAELVDELRECARRVGRAASSRGRMTRQVAREGRLRL